MPFPGRCSRHPFDRSVWPVNDIRWPANLTHGGVAYAHAAGVPAYWEKKEGRRADEKEHAAAGPLPTAPPE